MNTNQQTNELRNTVAELTSEVCHLRHQNGTLKDMNRKQRLVIKYLLMRPHLESGSREMAEGDELCAALGFRPWKMPKISDITKAYQMEFEFMITDG